MGLAFRKRVRLTDHIWLNLSTGIPSLSVRIGRAVFNTKRGFSSVRLGKGLSWRDRD